MKEFYFLIPSENQYQKIEVIKLLTWESLNTQIHMGAPSDLRLQILCKLKASERYSAVSSKLYKYTTGATGLWWQ